MINKIWVITAAHCFCADNGNKFFKCKKRGKVWIPTGHNPKRDVKIVYNIQPTQMRYSGDSNTRKVDKLIIHSKYDLKGYDINTKIWNLESKILDTNMYNDIALVNEIV